MCHVSSEQLTQNLHIKQTLPPLGCDIEPVFHLHVPLGHAPVDSQPDLSEDAAGGDVELCAGEVLADTVPRPEAEGGQGGVHVLESVCFVAIVVVVVVVVVEPALRPELVRVWKQAGVTVVDVVLHADERADGEHELVDADGLLEHTRQRRDDGRVQAERLLDDGVEEREVLDFVE